MTVHRLQAVFHRSARRLTPRLAQMHRLAQVARDERFIAEILTAGSASTPTIYRNSGRFPRRRWPWRISSGSISSTRPLHAGRPAGRTSSTSGPCSATMVPAFRSFTRRRTSTRAATSKRRWIRCSGPSQGQEQLRIERAEARPASNAQGRRHPRWPADRPPSCRSRGMRMLKLRTGGLHWPEIAQDSGSESETGVSGLQEPRRFSMAGDRLKHGTGCAWPNFAGRHYIRFVYPRGECWRQV